MIFVGGADAVDYATMATTATAPMMGAYLLLPSFSVLDSMVDVGDACEVFAVDDPAVDELSWPFMPGNEETEEEGAGTAVVLPKIGADVVVPVVDVFTFVAKPIRFSSASKIA